MKTQEQILIEQLPKDHADRNKWLRINGVGEEAEELRVEAILSDTSTSLAEKCNEIMNMFRPKNGPIQAPQYPPHNNRW